jgi:ribonuclease P protein component
VRNRIKRQVREFFRRRRGELPEATDLLIIVRQGAAELPGKTLLGELDRLLTQRRQRKP